MTAEISIINRNAVALAADSAVTLQLPEGPKIYLTNKLFMLSKYQPVGIMVYGSAEFMTVPWEIIIKRYRAQLGEKSHRRLEDYASEFLDFVECCSPAVSSDRQKAYCYSFVRSWLERLTHRLEHSLAEEIKVGPITEKQVRDRFREIFRDDIAHQKNHPKLDRLLGLSAGKILKLYRAQINEAIQGALNKLAAAVPRRELENACAAVFLRDLYWSQDSGVVLAGYGTDQFYPSVRSYQLGGVIGDKLRVMEDRRRRTDIGETHWAGILAFAQSEMVSLFMNGIDDEFADFLTTSFEKVLVEGYPSVVDKNFGKYLPKSRRSRTLAKLQEVGKEGVSMLRSALLAYAGEVHSQPIVEIVEHLPKEELAAMAEALVNLTSFKRHVTREAETVGGPIDVAVISRGDGFIWIKRKHYFSTDLNQHFLSNYYYDAKTMSGKHRGGKNASS